MSVVESSIQLWVKAKRLSFVVESQIPFALGGLVPQEDGVFYVSSSELSDEATRLHELFYELEIVSPENMPQHDYVADLKTNVAALQEKELQQLITWVCRADRFAEGWLADAFNSGTLTRALRRLYFLTLCNEDGWPILFNHETDNSVPEGIPVFSLNEQIEGRTTGSRRKCASKECPGWFIGVLWETGQQMYLCSEGWHYDHVKQRIDVVGGGKISARFISPKPSGVEPLPQAEWPTRSDLINRKGWRISAT
jgi:hypothetical protein